MSTDHVKATLEIGDTKVTFEGPREFVEAQVTKYTSNRTSKPQDGNVIALASNSENATPSERDLIREKRPANHIETVAVLAFGLTLNGKDEFTDEDIRKAYIRAGVRPPKVVAQALRDAKNRADFLEPGSKKGTYKLSPHGDRTVRFDLPQSE